MITFIKFQHISKTVTARVMLNYEEDKKEVTVELLGCKDCPRERLLITQINGKWTTDSTFAKNFRAIYLDILNEINWICSQNYVEAKVIGENSRLANLN
jgi:hypothetical protein